VYAITPEAITGKHGVLPPLDQRWPVRNDTLSPGWKSARDVAENAAPIDAVPPRIDAT
jgi:hypothetical protein